jgi:3-dehydroquinate synthase
VLIDPDTLQTLPAVQLAAGFAEAVKMALCFDRAFFEEMEDSEPFKDLETIIRKSLEIKRRVVEEDEREGGLRKVLNFGHTLAHAIESESHTSGAPLLHGESVALGMIPMCSPQVRSRLIPVLEKWGLSTRWEGDPFRLLGAMEHDKKMNGSRITVIRVLQIGSFTMEQIPFSRFREEVKGMI